MHYSLIWTMKSLKSRGGLTRGRGMTESQRLVWLQAMPACAEVNMAMQELTGVDHATSEQHKDVGKSRQDRDQRDTTTIVTTLQNRSPFDCGESLKNIINGQVASAPVNVDDAKSIGDDIIIKAPDGTTAERSEVHAKGPCGDDSQ